MSGKKVKGALVSMPSIENLAPPRVVVFQYNPGQLTRTVTPDTTDSKPARFAGVPKETISLTVEFDATDYMADGKEALWGVYPQISTLELMVYPGLARLAVDRVRAAAGVVELNPPSVPITMFVWGAKRVVPVRLGEFSITEQVFDYDLNPLRASVTLKLAVMSYDDFPVTSLLDLTSLAGRALFTAHHAYKEVLAGKAMLETGGKLFSGEYNNSLNSFKG